MKVALWVIGKTSFEYLKEGMQIYEKRLQHYLSFELYVFPSIKNAQKLTPTQLKIKEGQLVLKKLKAEDSLIVLDEKGKSKTSVQFADFLEHQLQRSHKRIIFLIGGAYGFSDAIYQRSQQKLALSKMTFSHQMVRLIFLEQLYRAMTILRNEPYHHI